MSGEFQYRETKRDDVKAIVDLHRASIVPVWEEVDKEYDLSRIEQVIGARVGLDHMVSVFDGECLVGYLWGTLFEDPTQELLVDEVLMVLVHQDYYGRGIGGRLMEMEREHAREKGAGILKLQVLSRNQRALAFYEKKGFKEIMKIMTLEP